LLYIVEKNSMQIDMLQIGKIYFCLIH
jgi:hypothetical protein